MQYAAIVGMVNNSTGVAGSRLDLTDSTQLQNVLSTSTLALQNVTGGSVTINPTILAAAASGMSSVNNLVNTAAASGANSTDMLIQVSVITPVHQMKAFCRTRSVKAGRALHNLLLLNQIHIICPCFQWSMSVRREIRSSQGHDQRL